MPRGAIRLWTDEKIEAALREATQTLGHFPSAADLRSLGRNDLCCAVTKAGGLLAWSDRLGLPRVHSDSDTGWDGERLFVELCVEQGLPAMRQPRVKSPFDVLVADVLRVDVKSARFASYAKNEGWFYRIAKAPQADVVALVQLDTREFYGLPWVVCPTTNVKVSRDGGKYAPYRNNWPLIRQLIATRQEERRRLTDTAA